MSFALAALIALAPSSSLARGSVASALLAQDTRAHEDAHYGYKIRPPKDWTEVPIKVNEAWQVAKYLSPRAYFYTDKNDGWTREHKPEMTVIAFIEKKPEPPAPSPDPTKKPDVIVIENPYKNYEDYLERNYHEGGYYIAGDEKGDVEGVPVRKLDIKVEKLSYSGPRHIVTWIFDAPDVDFAVQFEMFEDAYAKLKKDCEGSLKSFRLIPRTGAPLTAAAGATTLESPWNLDDLSPYERRVRRQQHEKELHDKALANVPDGWTAKQIGRFLVINHGDDRAAARMVENGEALLGWLEKSFPFVGPEEYVRGPILRICKDWEEESSMQKGSGWSWSRLEIITHDPREDWISWSFGNFNRRLFELWFSERDDDLYYAFPPWLSMGLGEVAADAVVKNGKVEFKDEGWDRDQLRERLHEGKMRSPKELLQMTTANLIDQNSDWGIQHDYEALVRFFISPAAQRSARTKDMLATYVRNLGLVIDEIKKDDAAKGKAPDTSKPKTEEEEEARFAKERNAWKDRQQQIAGDVFQRTFRTWTDKDWEDLEKVYFKSML